jgi:hypothetical protein
MCHHADNHREERRGVLRILAGAVVGLAGLLYSRHDAAGAEACGLKCIQKDGGTCTKPKHHKGFHKCSKGHSF